MTTTTLEKPQTRRKDGTFLPGVVTNPGGRPRIAQEWREIAQAWCTKHGWRKLVRLTEHRTPDIQMRATELIFAYAYGRPSAHLLVTGPDQFQAFIEQLRAANGLPPTGVVEAQDKVLPAPMAQDAAHNGVQSAQSDQPSGVPDRVVDNK